MEHSRRWEKRIARHDSKIDVRNLIRSGHDAETRVAVADASTNLLDTVSNDNLVLIWPSSYTGWLLQEQTNALAQGLGLN
jgi:hypothetical protein